LLSLTSWLFALAAAIVTLPTASPGVTYSDAVARAAGNRKAVAIVIGKTLFVHEWPAQVSNVYANGIDDYVVAGLRVSGVHFHGALTRSGFTNEMSELLTQTFAAAPQVEEVDVWATVPLNVGKGVVVSGDLAKPTSRTVFSASVRRSQMRTLQRVLNGRNSFWDQDWVHAALK